jgi:phosphoglycolate phosphatase
MYQTILFDLDGTLTDPGIGITNSAAYALEKFGIQVDDRRELYKWIGPPLQDSFTQFCGFSKEDTKRAVVYYREYYKERGIYENRLYDGIEKMLKTLFDAGKTLLVATSKPELFAVQILEYFQIRQYFAYVAGATMDGTRSKKEDVIACALQAAGISDRSRTVMVGDREYDVAGAKKAGLSSIGVLYGYGSRRELADAGADALAEQPVDIIRCCMPKA